MVRAILNGSKSQTRRIVKPQDSIHGPTATGSLFWIPANMQGEIEPNCATIEAHTKCPYGSVGALLIVKEAAWMWCEKVPNGKTKTGRPKFRYEPLRCAAIFYCADHPEKPTISVVSEYRGYEWGWRKKIGRFLPRWASRLTLKITEVRVQRLQDISEDDCIAEGIEPGYLQRTCEPFYGAGFNTPFAAYLDLWESINGEGSWALNPFVWAISLKVVK